MAHNKYHPESDRANLELREGIPRHRRWGRPSEQLQPHVGYEWWREISLLETVGQEVYTFGRSKSSHSLSESCCVLGVSHVPSSMKVEKGAAIESGSEEKPVHYLYYNNEYEKSGWDGYSEFAAKFGEVEVVQCEVQSGGG